MPTTYLTLAPGKTFTIGETIRVNYLGKRYHPQSKQIRLGIEAPLTTKIQREETQKKTILNQWSEDNILDVP